jgi:trehalose-6-phosphate synthase
MKKYKDYVKEIEELRKKYNLRIDQVLLLQIAAAFKVDKKDYDQLKEDFINESSNIRKSE